MRSIFIDKQKRFTYVAFLQLTSWMSVILALTISREVIRTASKGNNMSPSPRFSPGSRGYIIPIGGAEDKLQDKAILHHFVRLSGGDRANILVIPTASRLEDTGDRYCQIFKDMGASARSLPIIERKDADRSSSLELLRRQQAFL